MDSHHTDADMRELRVLEQIERNPRISQRQLAGELGVALGVANACVHTLARKGLVKIRGESNRSLSYHLTKAGLVHKAALALEWTNNTIGDYVRSRSQVRDQLSRIAEMGVDTAVILGADEVAELVALVAPQAGISIRAAIPVGSRRIGDVLAGIPVVELDELDLTGVDAAIVASPDEPDDRTMAVFSGIAVFDLSGQRVEYAERSTPPQVSVPHLTYNRQGPTR